MRKALLSALTILSSGCAPALAPHTPFMPNLAHRNDVSSLLHVSTTGVELQTAYALTDRWALTAELLGDRRPWKERTLFAAGLGAGYSWLPGADTRFTLYTGAGGGGGQSGFTTTNLYFIDSGERQESRYAQAYVQPTINCDLGVLAINVAVRASGVYFFRLRDGPYPGLGWPPGPGYNGQQACYLQPTMQYCADIGQHLQLVSSTGLGLVLYNPRAANISRLLVGVGLQWHLSKRTQNY